MNNNIEDQTIKTYDAIAADYLTRWHDRSPLEVQFERFVSMLTVYNLNQQPILDVGCGPGFDTAQLKGYGLNVIGLDLSWKMLATGKRNFPGEFVQADMRHLPFSETFGGLWISASLLHIPRDETPNTLMELTRLLLPGGLLYLSLKEGFGESWKTNPYNKPRFFCLWQPAALDGMLEQVGLQIVASWNGIGREDTWLIRFARKAIHQTHPIQLG